MRLNSSFQRNLLVSTAYSSREWPGEARMGNYFSKSFRASNSSLARGGAARSWYGARFSGLNKIPQNSRKYHNYGILKFLSVDVAALIQTGRLKCAMLLTAIWEKSHLASSNAQTAGVSDREFYCNIQISVGRIQIILVKRQLYRMSTVYHL